MELAVVAPLFLLLLAGIMEFGQAFRIEHMLSRTCRRATRRAVVAGVTKSQVLGLAKNQCVENLGISEEYVTVEVAVNGNAEADLSQAQEGDEIGVTVSLPYSQAGVGFYANMFSNAILTSTCTLEHE